MTTSEAQGPEPKSVSATPSAPAAPAKPAPAPPKARQAGGKKWIGRLVVLAILAGVAYAAVPRIKLALASVSTDDAFINGHVTFVAPRVTGQVARVLVDDNNRVRKGDLLVQLDKEPYEVQVKIAQAAVDAAQADLTAEQAHVRGMEGQARSARYELQRAVEDVDNQVALLRSKVATLESKKATLSRAQADFDRETPLLKSGVVSKQEFDAYDEARKVADAQVQEAMQGVEQVRVGLGLPPSPPSGAGLADVPADLDQSFSSVKEAQFKLSQIASQLGVVSSSFDTSPQKMIDEFYNRDPEKNLDRIYAQLVKDAPSIKQSETKLAEAQRNLDEADLNLRYCDIVAEIDGVVAKRDVNPGNHVVAGEALMAVRSLTDIWVDANFKETQLSELRIGQPVDLDVDMYGSEKTFKGRISGFTMGTGSTLALLPPENATGNFVKVVQRLPVRIDLLDYSPEKTPLFVGLSVTPHVLVNDPPAGPNAGQVLQPYLAQSNAPRPDAQTASAPNR